MSKLDRIKKEILELISCAKDQHLRPQEVEKVLSQKLGISQSTIKQALKDMLKERKLVKTYRDSSSHVEIPHVESIRAARPMKVVFDDKGEPWICDENVDPIDDLAEQGCWRSKDKAFTKND